MQRERPPSPDAGPAPVFYKNAKPAACLKCRKDLKDGELIRPTDGGVLCLPCAGLGGLEFLPSGDVALTRRAQKHAQRWAPVLEWKRRRKRYERQGIIVEPAAIQAATAACTTDATTREAKREVDRHRRERDDQTYRAEFAQAIRQLFPSCPAGVPEEVAGHACEKHSGRVGRCAAAKDFSEKAITLAVVAHVRHLETGYDRLLAMGYERDRARQHIRDRLQDVLETWRRPLPPGHSPQPRPPPAATPRAEAGDDAEAPGRKLYTGAGSFFIDDDSSEN